MNSVALQLRMLLEEDEKTFRKAVLEFKDIEPDWEFAFGFDESISFSHYVEMLKQWRVGENIPNDWVPNTYLVGVVENEIVGRVSIRHALNDFLERYGGHIGYGVVPSRRNNGYASEMLKQALSEAAVLGLHEVLVTVDDDNIASIRVVEKNGGVLENIVTGTGSDGPKRRYWITIDNE